MISHNFQRIAFLLVFVMFYLSKLIISQGYNPPQNLYVDSLTNTAHWDPPPIVVLPLETFEGVEFPPDGWSDFSMCDTGWYRAEYVDLSGFTIPSGDGYFAVTDVHNIICDHTSDYFYLPAVDLSAANDFRLEFDYFYTGVGGQLAYVCFSEDSIGWMVMKSLSLSNDWVNASESLAMFSGPDKPDTWFSFLGTYNYPDFGSGFAVDNVTIVGGEADVAGYYVILDGEIIDSVPADQTYYHFEELTEGQIYETCIMANYDTLVSEWICTNWIFRIINNLTDLNMDNTVSVYPIPVLDNLNVKSNNSIKSVRIFNIRGQLIYEVNKLSEKSVSLEVEILEQGLYLVMVETNEKVSFEKIVIIK